MKLLENKEKSVKLYKGRENILNLCKSRAKTVKQRKIGAKAANIY